jgi:hypothetical protein
VVAHPVERLGTQVEVHEGDVSAPRRVVVAAIDVGRERVFAGVAAGAVAAVVPERDGFGECNVEPQGSGDARGHLRHLERVREACALVISRENEHLRLARQPAEGGGVQDAVAVALETRAQRIGFLVDETCAGARGPSGSGCEQIVLALLARLAAERFDGAERRARVGVGRAHAGAVAVVGVTGHGGRPASGAFVHCKR